MKTFCHYVPRCYLKHFALNEKQIRVYYKQKKLDKVVSIESIAGEKNFYDVNLEKYLALNIERKWNAFINYIKANNCMPIRESEEYSIFLDFLIVQDVRVKNNRDELSSYSTNALKEDIKIYHNMDIIDWFNSKEIRDIYKKKSYKLMINFTNSNFITSDNPVFSACNMAFDENNNLRSFNQDGLILKNNRIFFPLSSRYAVLGYHANEPEFKIYHCNDESIIEHFNNTLAKDPRNSLILGLKS